MADSIELTRRRLLGGLVTVGAAGAGAGAGTMALFSDEETSTGNTIQAGTLTLDFASSGTFSFSTSLAPTETTGDSLTLVNGGSLGGSLDVDVSYTESDGSPNDTDMSGDAVAQNLKVETLTYGGTDLTAQLPGTGPWTLYDLANNAHGASESTQNDLINLADPAGGTEFSIELRLGNVGNDFQADGIAIDFTFHLNQTDDQ